MAALPHTFFGTVVTRSFSSPLPSSPLPSPPLSSVPMCTLLICLSLPSILTSASWDPLPFAQNPASAAGVAAGGLGLSLAVWQYHYTLQYIGVLGTILIVLRKAASYDSPTEFFEEV